MGLFDAAKNAMNGNKAYKAHVDAGKLANEGKPDQAEAKFREAEKLYEDAYRRGLEAPKILHAYAVLLLRLGDFEKAREVLEKMSRLKGLTDDQWSDLRVQYSIYLWKTGQLDRAIETIGRAAANNMSGTIYGMLGMYRVDKAKQTGDFAQALEFNQEALDYDDEDAATLDNMGQLYQAMAEAEADGEKAAGYREKAIGFYEKAHEIKPRQITTIYCLARMLHEDGDDERARELLSCRDTLYISAICPITRQMLDALAKEIG